jgi:diamine N-acetyltransferase
MFDPGFTFVGTWNREIFSALKREFPQVNLNTDMTSSSVSVHFRPITRENLQDCLALEVAVAQRAWVAPNAKSLAEAYVNPMLQPYGVYEKTSLGFETPVSPMVGFVMLEIAGGVGFILRLMIGEHFQRQGFARATLREVIRRLRLNPDVQLIATSHIRQNHNIAALFHSEGFVPWEIEYAHGHEENFLRLP